MTPSWYLDFSVVTSFTGGGNWARTTTGVKAKAAAINESIIMSIIQTLNYGVLKQKRCAHQGRNIRCILYVTKLQSHTSSGTMRSIRYMRSYDVSGRCTCAAYVDAKIRVFGGDNANPTHAFDVPHPKKPQYNVRRIPIEQ